MKAAKQAIDIAIANDKGNFDYRQEQLDIKIQAEDYEQEREAADAVSSRMRLIRSCQ